MDDDFALYVIGTNSSDIDWLSLKVDDPQWRRAARPEDALRSLVDEFSSDERKGWEQLVAAAEVRATALRSFAAESFARREKEGKSASPDVSDSEAVAKEFEKACPSESVALGGALEQAMGALEAVLSDEHAECLAGILSSRDNDQESREPPRFAVGEIQRYVLWRVFDLGWTIKLFGHFDRFSVGYHGRDASKAERIGKKYQWIAYHEIMALVADHYQYRDRFREEDGDRLYQGPWQNYFRDIDPSCTLRSLPGGTSWRVQPASWWASARYNSWGDPARPRDWVLSADDLPRVEDLLVVTDSADRSGWVNGQGSFSWEQKPPADRESTDVELRELWYMFIGYLVRADDAASFLAWAETVDFMGRWMPEAGGGHEVFLGEHAWAPAFHYVQRPYYGEGGWTQPRHGCPVKVLTLTSTHLREKSGFDCSMEESYTLHLPVGDLVCGLGIRWSGRGADFLDGENRIVAQDPAVHSEGPSAMLLREDLLGGFLDREKLTICWAVLGEKRVISPGYGAGARYPWLRMSGAYRLSKGRAVGFLKHMADDLKREEGHGPDLKVVRIVRTRIGNGQ